MIENNFTSVTAAFEMLLDEIRSEIEFINRIGARAFEAGDYHKAQKAIERASLVTGFRDKVMAMRREWENLFTRDEGEEDTEGHTERRNLGPSQCGLPSREDAYYRPILEALRALGGSAPISQVLDCVLQNMRGTLNEADFEPIASNPDVPRWRKTAQWARNSMVKMGLLRNDSPRGIWQISDAGIRYLQSEING